jgi:hypothetical protein
MDLTHFHHPDDPDADYAIMDRRNNQTGSICYFWEFISWYDTNIMMRLLGHYRLFQLCKNSHAIKKTGLAAENGYILNYRENRILENSWVQLIPFRNLLANKSRNLEIKSINRTLLFKRTEILQYFLVAAQSDFDKALLDAARQISHPAFLSDSPLTNIHLEIQQNHQHNTTLAKNEFHVHPVIKEQAPPAATAKGKEKDVFSKRQILILFDLLTKTGMIEPINLNKPNKFPAVAHLLRAITGKSEDSWLAELNDHRNKDLYSWHADGERQELIRMLINLTEKFDGAGFKTVVTAANQKIRELEHAAR